MPKYVIEREIPGAGKLSKEELTGNFGKILQRARSRAADSMGRELCNRR
jgi:hypothetical protein